MLVHPAGLIFIENVCAECLVCGRVEARRFDGWVIGQADFIRQLLERVLELFRIDRFAMSSHFNSIMFNVVFDWPVSMRKLNSRIESDSVITVEPEFNDGMEALRVIRHIPDPLADFR